MFSSFETVHINDGPTRQTDGKLQAKVTRHHWGPQWKLQHEQLPSLLYTVLPGDYACKSW